VTDSQPATQPASHIAIAKTRYAIASHLKSRTPSFPINVIKVEIANKNKLRKSV